MYKDFKKYEVFEDGRVYSYVSKRFLKPQKNGRGYYLLKLSDNNGESKTYQVHRIIYEAIKGQIPENYEINHLDEDPSNNAIWNLSACSHLENINYGTRTARSAEKQSKQVAAYKDGVLVMTFSSANEAQRQGFNLGHVAACARGERKSHRGYQWLYFVDSPPLFYIAA